MEEISPFRKGPWLCDAQRRAEARLFWVYSRSSTWNKTGTLFVLHQQYERLSRLSWGFHRSFHGIQEFHSKPLDHNTVVRLSLFMLGKNTFYGDPEKLIETMMRFTELRRTGGGIGLAYSTQFCSISLKWKIWHLLQNSGLKLPPTGWSREAQTCTN